MEIEASHAPCGSRFDFLLSTNVFITIEAAMKQGREGKGREGKGGCDEYLTRRARTVCQQGFLSFSPAERVSLVPPGALL